MSLTLRQVRYFVATAEIGQISQAAIHLNISQSAVTTAIKELEAMLGVQLFLRSAQGMNLTDAGRHFLNRAYVILRSVDDALNSPLPDYRASGVLHLAASYTVIGYFLSHHLQRLEHWHPDVTIEVHEQERQAIEQGLLEGRFDMAVVLTANLTHPDIVSKPCSTPNAACGCPAITHCASAPPSASPTWRRNPYILLTVDEAEQSAMRYWENARQKPRVRVRTSSVEAVRSMVANGSGVAILSDLVHRPWSLEGKRIETLSVSDPVTPMSVGLAWHRERAFTPAMQAFRDYFHDAFLAPQQLSARR